MDCSLCFFPVLAFGLILMTLGIWERADCKKVSVNEDAVTLPVFSCVPLGCKDFVSCEAYRNGTLNVSSSSTNVYCCESRINTCQVTRKLRTTWTIHYKCGESGKVQTFVRRCPDDESYRCPYKIQDFEYQWIYNRHTYRQKYPTGAYFLIVIGCIITCVSFGLTLDEPGHAGTIIECRPRDISKRPSSRPLPDECFQPPKEKREDWTSPIRDCPHGHNHFYPGNLIDCKSDGNTWRIACIIRESKKSLLIHYQSLDKKWDEWISKDNYTRLARHGTHTTRQQTRRFQCGDYVDVKCVQGWHAAEYRDDLGFCHCLECYATIPISEGSILPYRTKTRQICDLVLPRVQPSAPPREDAPPIYVDTRRGPPAYEPSAPPPDYEKVEVVMDPIL